RGTRRTRPLPPPRPPRSRPSTSRCLHAAGRQRAGTISARASRRDCASCPRTTPAPHSSCATRCPTSGRPRCSWTAIASSGWQAHSKARCRCRDREYVLDRRRQGVVTVLHGLWHWTTGVFGHIGDISPYWLVIALGL